MQWRRDERDAARDSAYYGIVLLADASSDTQWQSIADWAPGLGPCYESTYFLAPHASFNLTGTFRPQNEDGSYELGPTTVRLGSITKFPIANPFGGPGGQLTIDPPKP